MQACRSIAVSHSDSGGSLAASGQSAGRSSSRGLRRRLCFLGASSGFNEDGVYLMENAGCSPPPEALPRGATVPCERDAIVGLLQNAKKDGGLGRRPTADGAALALRDHWAASTSNGTCVSGCIFVMARPSAGDAGDAGPAAWIYEGDLDGGEIREPNAPRVAPHQDEAIMASACVSRRLLSPAAALPLKNFRFGFAGRPPLAVPVRLSPLELALDPTLAKT